MLLCLVTLSSHFTSLSSQKPGFSTSTQTYCWKGGFRQIRSVWFLTSSLVHAGFQPDSIMIRGNVRGDYGERVHQR